jgi:hypothetical protein
MREAGVAAEAACVMTEVLQDRGAPRWLREHAAFLLGYLTDPVAIDPLRDAANDEREHPSIRHAALWALGDIAYPDSETIYDLASIVEAGALSTRLMRAATYSLAMLHPEPVGDVAGAASRALKARATDRDDLTRQLAECGLVDRARSRAMRERAHEIELWGIQAGLAATLAAWPTGVSGVASAQADLGQPQESLQFERRDDTGA